MAEKNSEDTSKDIALGAMAMTGLIIAVGATVTAVAGFVGVFTGLTAAAAVTAGLTVAGAGFTFMTLGCLYKGVEQALSKNGKKAAAYFLAAPVASSCMNLMIEAQELIQNVQPQAEAREAASVFNPRAAAQRATVSGLEITTPASSAGTPAVTVTRTNAVG